MNAHNSHEWEARTIELLDECSLLRVIDIHVNAFTSRFGFGPNLVILKTSHRGALIRELARATNAPPQMIIHEPFFVNDATIVCTIPHKDEMFMELRGAGSRSLTL